MTTEVSIGREDSGVHVTGRGGRRRSLNEQIWLLASQDIQVSALVPVKWVKCIVRHWAEQLLILPSSNSPAAL